MTDSQILACLLERSTWTLDWLHRIDRRLEEGDARMDEMTERIAALETRKGRSEMPGWERAVKTLLPYLIGLVTLAATGSIERALQIVAQLTSK